MQWRVRHVASLICWLALPAVIPACGEEFVEDPRCEADTSLPCNEDPWVCEEGQNCWSDSTGTFSCFNAGAGLPGGECEPLVGSSTCVADHGCVALNGGSPMGHCRAYCDTQDPCKTCEAGFNCTELVFTSGARMSFCLPG